MPQTFQILTPCHQNWDTMPLTDAGRHCAVCDREVVDFTDCDPAAARAALEQAAAEGRRVCGRAPVDRRRRVVFSTFRRHVLTNGLAMLLGTGAMACQLPPPQDGEQAVGEGVAPAILPDQPPEAAPEAMGQRPEPARVVMGDMVAVPPRPATAETGGHGQEGSPPECRPAPIGESEMTIKPGKEVVLEGSTILPGPPPPSSLDIQQHPDDAGADRHPARIRIMRARKGDPRHDRQGGGDDF